MSQPHSYSVWSLCIHFHVKFAFVSCASVRVSAVFREVRVLPRLLIEADCFMVVRFRLHIIASGRKSLEPVIEVYDMKKK